MFWILWIWIRMMSNMSYCRFENTLSDLEDCWENMDEPVSMSEGKCRIKLIQLCIDISNDFEDEIEHENE